MKYVILFAFLFACTASAQAQAAVQQDTLAIRKDVWPHATHPPEPMDSLSKFIIYPENARRAGIEGVVQVSALIGYDGFVLRVKIDKSSNAIFDDAAFRAMNKMQYKPATANGVPTRAWIKQDVIFKLK